MHKPLVLGLAGEFLSGKSSAAAFYVDKFSAKRLRFSGILDDILGILDLPLTRDNEQKLGVALRESFGEGVLAYALAKSARFGKKEIFVVDGLRKIEELQVLKQLPEFKLIYIQSTLENRFNRLQQRDEKEGEKYLSKEEFVKSHEHEADKDICKLGQFADFVVENDGSKSNFQDQLTKILTESL